MEKWELNRSLSGILSSFQYQLHVQIYNQLDESASDQVHQLNNRFDRKFDNDNDGEWMISSHQFYNEAGLSPFDVWSEGCEATSFNIFVKGIDRCKPWYLGMFIARNFDSACEIAAKYHNMEASFNKNKLTLWNCRLFDHEIF
jgi:hypothetical protein